MKTPTITMPIEQAQEHYREYLEAVKTRKEKYYEELKNVYRHLAKGNKVLDIFEVFKQCPIDENGEPKIAIAPVTSRTITLQKEAFGSGTFTPYDRWSRANKDDIHLPTNTFQAWKEQSENGSVNRWNAGVDTRHRVETKVPIVPPMLLPDSKSLDGYFILFEVGEWTMPQKARAMKGDPYLLKRINTNAFAILAEWDVTDVEVAVVRGIEEA